MNTPGQGRPGRPQTRVGPTDGTQNRGQPVAERLGSCKGFASRPEPPLAAWRRSPSAPRQVTGDPTRPHRSCPAPGRLPRVPAAARLGARESAPAVHGGTVRRAHRDRRPERLPEPAPSRARRPPPGRRQAPTDSEQLSPALSLALRGRGGGAQRVAQRFTADACEVRDDRSIQRNGAAKVKAGRKLTELDVDGRLAEEVLIEVAPPP